MRNRPFSPGEAMRLLAIDCATNACSAALWIDDRPGPRRFDTMRRGHGEVVVPMIREVMDEAGLSFGGLDAVAATIGPGAFTGLRIGLAAARGIAIAARLPVLGVTTLEAVAAAQVTDCPAVLVALDSKRRDIYVQLFSAGAEPLSEARALMPEEAAALVAPLSRVGLAGDAADAVAAAIVPARKGITRLRDADHPHAAVVAELAVRRLRNSPPPESPPGALYLRAPDAVPAARRRPGIAR